MDAMGYIIFGIIIAISCVLTELLMRRHYKWYRQKVLAYIDSDTKLQEELKDRYGWR